MERGASVLVRDRRVITVRHPRGAAPNPSSWLFSSSSLSSRWPWARRPSP